MILHGPLEAGNPRLYLPHLVLVDVQIYGLPALHQQLLHTSNMKVVVLALGPVGPTRPLSTAPMAGARKLGAQVVVAVLSVVQNHWEVCATGVQVEPTGPTVVDKPGDVFVARIAYPHDRAGGLGVEPEITFLVEGVGYGGRRQGTCLVEVELADVAFVFGAYAGLLAPVAVEWDLGVFALEVVLLVARVRDLFVELCH